MASSVYTRSPSHSPHMYLHTHPHTCTLLLTPAHSPSHLHTHPHTCTLLTPAHSRALTPAHSPSHLNTPPHTLASPTHTPPYTHTPHTTKHQHQRPLPGSLTRTLLPHLHSLDTSPCLYHDTLSLSTRRSLVHALCISPTPTHTHTHAHTYLLERSPRLVGEV